MARPAAPSTDRVEKPDEEWRRILTPMQYFVTREKGTEYAFTGEYWDCRDAGTYRCVACGASLFTDREKFDSGCGWPAFDRPTRGARIAEHLDTSLGMVRTEVTCERCGAHLGHVFPDGPTETGRRYCINSAALRLEREAPLPSDAPAK